MCNGRVVGTEVSKREGDHFAAALDMSFEIEAPSWLALRTPPPQVKDDPELQEPVAQNEFGGPLFAHTSPIYVNLAGQGVFDTQTAAQLAAQMKSDWKEIQAQAVFDDPSQRERVSQVYEEAIKSLEQQLARRGG